MQRILSAIVFVGVFIAAPAFADINKPFTFAIIGDGPYGADQESKYDNLIADINADDPIKFVIHAGDIKGGGEMCTDALLNRRFNQLQQLRSPLVYTPGDNEWTDCHRTSNGSYVPTERLDYVRGLFFPAPGFTTGSYQKAVDTQAHSPGYEKFVENTLFTMKRVVFSQIHVVGSNNNLRPWDQLPGGDLPAERLAEYEERNEAALAWLAYTFEVAAKKSSPGVFITIHANPNFNLSRDDEAARAGFNDFLDALKAAVVAYGKPVVLAHGDSHIFRIDTPYVRPWYYNDNADTPEANEKIGNLVRMETFGHFDNHWIKVAVDPRSRTVFSFLPQIVEANL